MEWVICLVKALFEVDHRKTDSPWPESQVFIFWSVANGEKMGKPWNARSCCRSLEPPPAAPWRVVCPQLCSDSLYLCVPDFMFLCTHRGTDTHRPIPLCTHASCSYLCFQLFRETQANNHLHVPWGHISSYGSHTAWKMTPCRKLKKGVSVPFTYPWAKVNG